VGWLHKAIIDETNNLPMHIASRKYAELLLDADFCVYSQHLSGIYNNVADALSRRTDLSDNDLTKFICTNFPPQVPRSIKICPLLQVIHQQKQIEVDLVTTLGRLRQRKY
jgi:hypothetical protein